MSSAQVLRGSASPAADGLRRLPRQGDMHRIGMTIATGVAMQASLRLPRLFPCGTASSDCKILIPRAFPFA
ncbi:hypothetical protein A7X12_09930 [Sphingomonas sp. TDK1]|nr:hypothetical protein A7X12_09930 [Sphingomonas sp. TDK1]